VETARKLLTLGITTPDRVARGKTVTVEKVEKSDSKIVGVFKSEEKRRSLAASIDLKDGTYNCSCEDFVYRRMFCKHLVAMFFKLPKDLQSKVLELLKGKKEIIEKSKYVSTGSKTVDMLIGNGIPLGMVLNVIGESKIGKTLFSVQCACSASIQLGAPTLYIDTEGVFVSEEVQKGFLSIFEKRFGKKPEVDFVELRDLTNFADFLGLNIRVQPSESGKRLDALIQYSTIAEESPVFQLMKDIGYKMLVIDSFSALIKRTVPVPPQQNYPARAAIVNVTFGRLDEIVSKLRIPAIVVNHTSKAPDNPFAHGKMYGGSAMIYNSKLILQILRHKEEGKRRFKLVYAPAQLEKIVDVELKKDFGYV
jgi:RecA/RadA recombinase